MRDNLVPTIPGSAGYDLFAVTLPLRAALVVNYSFDPRRRSSGRPFYWELFLAEATVVRSLVTLNVQIDYFVNRKRLNRLMDVLEWSSIGQRVMLERPQHDY